MPLSQHNIDVENYDHIIWDWNGTLLNDIDLCIDVIGKLLASHGLPIPSVDEYKEIFGFPVRDYYIALGFDFLKTPYDMLADQYITEYNTRAHQAPLHSGAVEALEKIGQSGQKQSILSVAREGHVIEMMEAFDLTAHFTQICGTRDNLAASKHVRGLELMSEIGIPPDRTLMIGDTTHDHEVGIAMGVDVLLVAHGHQSLGRLRAAHSHVVEAL